MSLAEESLSAAVSGRGSSSATGTGGGEFMLFGVRIKVDPMRKCVSMNNLSEYVPVHDNSNPSNKSDNNEVVKAAAEGGVAGGYASADDAVPRQSDGGRERKRGVPWTEEEHKLFLIGLQKVGKGDWRGISRNYVRTRTPTQVASHAQKYFLRRSNLNRRRRRSSLFDITTDSVTATPMEEGENHGSSQAQTAAQPTTMSPPVTRNINGFSVVPFPITVSPVLLSAQDANPVENSAPIRSEWVNNPPGMLLRPVPVLPMSTPSTMIDLKLNHQVPLEPADVSLRLSLSSCEVQSSRDAAFQVMSSFKNRDDIINVA